MHAKVGCAMHGMVWYGIVWVMVARKIHGFKVQEGVVVSSAAMLCYYTSTN